MLHSAAELDAIQEFIHLWQLERHRHLVLERAVAELNIGIAQIGIVVLSSVFLLRLKPPMIIQWSAIRLLKVTSRPL